MRYLPQPGETVGNYLIEAAVESQGAMSRLYRVRHGILGSQHALKVLLPHLAEDEGIRKRFLSEARIQAVHRHPHIVPVTDVVNEAGVAGLVMDWLEGEDLEEHLRRVGKVPLLKAIRWTQQILSALSLVHRQGVIHRDLKPGNVFVVDDAVWVVDFGIAKVVEQQRTTMGGMLGTFGYMSPEQIEDPSTVDPRTDLFAVGAILYEMITGEPAFSGSIGTIISRVHAGQYTTIAALDTSGSEALETVSSVVDRALAARERRFESAEAFSAALDGVLDADRLQRQARLAELKAMSGNLRVHAGVLDLGGDAPSWEWLGRVAGWLGEVAKRQTVLAQERERLAGYSEERKRLLGTIRELEARPAPASPLRSSGARTTRSTYSMVQISAGTFLMGGPPGRSVTISRAFWLGTVPVTQELWMEVMGSNPSHFKGARHPVECVSWLDAARFANALSQKEGLEPCYVIAGDAVSWPKGLDCVGYRLPTEAEWEYAARAGQRHEYAGSDDVNAVAWYSDNSGGTTHPVGEKAPNGWGLYDMSGNVWECCWDRYGEYPKNASVDPLGASTGSVRVGRGGSWYAAPARVRVADRAMLTASASFAYLGLRLARSL